MAQEGGIGEDPDWRKAWGDHAGAFAAQFRQARLIEVPGGHYIQTTAPQLISAAISEMSR